VSPLSAEAITGVIHKRVKINVNLYIK
jgi:hypothetical protein